MGLLDDLNNGTVASASGEYAEAWKPNPGDGVEGIVVGVDRRTTDYSPDGYPIVTLRRADGTDIAVHGMSTVLKEEIAKANLRAGDQFAVIYDGERSGKNGRTFKAFRCAHRPAGVAAPAPAPAPVEEQPPF